MEKCPNCQTTTSGANATEYWNLIESYERLAESTGAVRDLVKCAENRLQKIATGVTSGERGDLNLAYSDHEKHVFAACRLLEVAKNAIHQHRIASKSSQGV
jgi:hypothetical protein